MEYPLCIGHHIELRSPGSDLSAAGLAQGEASPTQATEIIVVDNASPNDDPEIIKTMYPEIVFIQSRTNLGFAGGNNLGMRQAKGSLFYY